MREKNEEQPHPGRPETTCNATSGIFSMAGYLKYF